MIKAEPLKIRPSDLGYVQHLAKQGDDPHWERRLYFTISQMEPDQQAELLALYLLGRGGLRSFNVALASAQRQQRIPETLAEKCNLKSCLALGIRRFKKQERKSKNAA